MGEEDLFTKVSIGSGLKDGERVYQYEGYAGFLSPHRLKGSIERRGNKVFVYDERGVVKETIEFSGGENPLLSTFKAVDGFLVSLLRGFSSSNRDDPMHIQIKGMYVPIQSQTTKSGCFVATAVYGNSEASQVQVLRDFRDNVLMEHPLGRRFVDFYYSGAGKRVADFISEHLPSAIPLIRRGLDALVERYSTYK